MKGRGGIKSGDKQKGIADDVIAECTGLSVDVVKGL